MRQISLKAALDRAACADDFAVLEIARPACPDGGILVRNVHLSLDPYIGPRLRGRHMGEAPPAPMLDPVPGAVVGQVAESRSPGIVEGDWIHSMEGGWQEYSAIAAGAFRKLDPAAAPLAAHAGVLGMPGLTAWAGITQLAKVTDGDTVLVDAAAGPVGGTAGQIARLKGAARVVGIAGGPQKCRLVCETYGFDACIDYRSDGWKDRLKEALPDGASVFFENVSAEMAMTALSVSRPYVRGVLCGLTGASPSDGPTPHALNAGLLIGKRAQLSGLVVYDFYPHWYVFAEEASGWIRSGKLRFCEDRAAGLESAPALFEKLMRGENVGKAVITVSKEAP